MNRSNDERQLLLNLEKEVASAPKPVGKSPSIAHQSAQVFSLCERKIELERKEETKLYRGILNLVSHFK